MTPYFIVLILTVTIASVGRRSASTPIQQLSLAIIIFLLTIFAGLRNFTVGTDTGNYVQMLASTESFEDIWKTTEIGYNALMLLCVSVSDNYAFLLTMIAFIVVFNYVTVIVSVATRYETALFVFIILGSYTFFFNGARQGIAVSLCFLAIPFLLERRKKPYFLLMGIAALFHHSALIAMPLYFLAVQRSGWWQPVFVVLGSMVLMIFLSTFVKAASLVLDDKYAGYAEVGEGGGQITVAFLVAQGAMFFFMRRRVQDPNGYYQRLLNIYLIGLMPAIAATMSNVDPSGLLRLSTYFSHSAILLWPMTFVGINNNLLRGLVSLLFLTIAILFFTLTTYSFSNLVPYQINPEFVW